MNIPTNLSPAFSSALNNNQKASDFFYSITASQQQKIMEQSKMINTTSKMEDFVSHISSAAL